MRSGCEVMVRAHGAGIVIGLTASEGHHVYSSLEFLQLAAKERKGLGKTLALGQLLTSISDERQEDRITDRKVSKQNEKEEKMLFAKTK
jgi:hypothetical protein